MNELNQIRLDRLNKIANANEKAKADIKQANEDTRRACIKRIKEYCIPKYAELLELERAFEHATGMPNRLAVQVADGNSFLYYPGWHGGKVGFAVSKSDTSTYCYTVTEDGELWKNCSYHKQYPMNLDEMPYWMAVQFVDGFDKWEQKLLNMIDAL